MRQYDHDGNVKSYGPVSANFSKDLFDIVAAFLSTSDKSVTIVFNYNSNEPYSYGILDMTGRVIITKDRNIATEGINTIEIVADLAKGAYQLILQNSEKMVAHKFFYLSN